MNDSQSVARPVDQLGVFLHLDSIAPRSNLRVRSWLPTGVLEDLSENHLLNLRRMFLRWVSSRTEWTTVGNPRL
jgi:hypothetical protein